MDLVARLNALRPALHPRRLVRRAVGDPIHLCNLTLDLEVGGATNRVATVCNGLDSTRFMTSCLCLGQRGAMAERFDPRVLIWSVRRPDPLAPATIWRVAQTLRRYRVDILHTHGPQTLLCGVVAARLARVPLVVHTDHHGEPTTTDEGPLSPRLYARLADALIATSRPVAERLAARCGVPVEAVRVLPTAVSLDRFRPPYDPLQPRLTLGIEPDQFVMGAVGRLEQGRGFGQLLEVAAHLHRQGLDFRLLLVGEGPAEATLRTRARELEIQEHLLLAGAAKEVPAMLAAMDCFVLPRSPAGIPTVVLEAMACGLTVVAANAGGIAEVVRDGETGLLVPEDQPTIMARVIEQLAAAPERRAALGQGALEHITRHHAPAVAVEAHGALYRELLGGRGMIFDKSAES